MRPAGFEQGSESRLQPVESANQNAPADRRMNAELQADCVNAELQTAPLKFGANLAKRLQVAVRVEIEPCPTSRVAARIIRFVESGDVTRLRAIPITP